jgi:seryl-tRNA synthetase
MLEIPNLPHESVPYGEGPSATTSWCGARRAAPTRRGCGRTGSSPRRAAGSTSRRHDGDRRRLPGLPRRRRPAGARVGGFFLDRLGDEGFVEIAPPLLVNAASATATGQLPDKEGQMYQVADGYYLIPTSEVPVTNLHRGQILDEDALPLRYCAFTPCFRREAGSYGKDVRGLNRLHQFDKVEMVVFARPEESYALARGDDRDRRAHARRPRARVPAAADVHRRHGLHPGQEVRPGGLEPGPGALARGVVGVEHGGLPGRAPRGPLRPGGAQGQGKTRLVHTLNGSALAFPRTIAALLETHQTPEGDVVLPPPLRATWDGTGCLSPAQPSWSTVRGTSTRPSRQAGASASTAATGEAGDGHRVAGRGSTAAAAPRAGWRSGSTLGSSKAASRST